LLGVWRRRGGGLLRRREGVEGEGRRKERG
jgi:hypothetical protein